MDRCLCHKLVFSFILVGSYFLLPKYGFTFPPSFHLPSHFLYPLSHANIFHLAANVLCLFMLRCKPHFLATYAIAVLCSFLPSPQLSSLILHPSSEPEMTYGFSGVLFAMVGIAWGRVGRFREMFSRNKWFLIIPAFIPHINFLIHLYCLLLGYAYARLTPLRKLR